MSHQDTPSECAGDSTAESTPLLLPLSDTTNTRADCQLEPRDTALGHLGSTATLYNEFAECDS
ncbi:hypothetical protein GGI23_001175, partial [Coemansia sp. RSA 2559]